MTQEFGIKLDALISMFNRFIETNNSSNDASDVYVRSEWTNLRSLLYNRPVNLTSVHSYINRLDEKAPSEKEPLSPMLKPSRHPTPLSPIKPAKDLPEVNKKRLLQDVKQLITTFKTNNTKIFRS